MKSTATLGLATTGLLLFAFTSAFSQESSDDAADVWSVIEAVWNAEEKGDKKWAERFLSEDFAGWGKESPAPRSKSSIKYWDRFNVQIGEAVAHELYPLSIIVHDDIAIAHYLYRSAFKPKDGKIEMSNGRYTDVLVRTDDGWKFLTWHGGDD